MGGDWSVDGSDLELIISSESSRELGEPRQDDSEEGSRRRRSEVTSLLGPQVFGMPSGARDRPRRTISERLNSFRVCTGVVREREAVITDYLRVLAGPVAACKVSTMRPRKLAVSGQEVPGVDRTSPGTAITIAVSSVAGTRLVLARGQIRLPTVRLLKVLMLLFREAVGAPIKGRVYRGARRAVRDSLVERVL